ncbi:hypothetical protein EV360DRAFT_69961 [Lentinula raphanica]|nr:hypothetical protein EV360DRAFT_69961 [Lentinula raphanica]
MVQNPTYYKFLALRLALVFIFLSGACGLPISTTEPVVPQAPPELPATNSFNEMSPHTRPEPPVNLAAKTAQNPAVKPQGETTPTDGQKVATPWGTTLNTIPKHTDKPPSVLTDYNEVVVRWMLAKGRKPSSPRVIPKAADPNWKVFENLLLKELNDNFADVDLDGPYNKIQPEIFYDHSKCSFQDAFPLEGAETERETLEFGLVTKGLVSQKCDHVLVKLNLKTKKVEEWECITH